MEFTAKKKKISTKDFSQLPEDIIHHILSYLETSESNQTRIVCKTWYNAWLTCPTLNFHSFHGKKSYNLRRKFIRFNNTTLRRYKEQKIRIMQFVLGMYTPDFNSAPHVDKWIETTIRNRVKILQFDFQREPVGWSCSYTLPRTIFKAETLRELSICGSKVKIRKEVGDEVMFTNLRKLHLTDVYIKDDIFEDIISRCPLIENLCVQYCQGLARIKVTELDNLKKLTVCVWGKQFIEIYAPHLRYLDFRTKLRANLPLVTFFDNLGREFPELEDLTLVGCYGLERINILSRSIKRMTLSTMASLREVQIDAPSMISFELLNIDIFPCLFLINASTRWVSKISTMYYISKNNYQFYKLKRILTNLVQSKISVVLRSCFDDVKKKIPSCPIVELEELHLAFDSGTSTLEILNFLKAFLVTCHPKAIIIHRCANARWCVAVNRFLYKNLIEIRNQDCPTNDHEAKSWYQELKEAKFEVFDITKNDWQPSDWNCMPLPQPQRVRFRLEWGNCISS